MNKRQAKKAQKKTAQQVNAYMKHASGLRKGSESMAKEIDPLLRELHEKATGNKLSPTYRFKDGDETKYYKISKDYTGKEYELFKYVEFKQLPPDKNIQKKVKTIARDPYATPQNYAQHRKEWAHKSYTALTSGVRQTDERQGDKIKYTHNLKYMHYLKNASEIEYIMNTSAAWHIAIKAGYDSEQVLADWIELFNAISDAQNEIGDQAFMDELYNDIDHEKSLDYIVNKVDERIMEMMKGD